MRILFLDDDTERRDAFDKMHRHANMIVFTKTVTGAKDALRAIRFDVAFLDHDLADYGPYDMYGHRDEYTGQHVATFIAAMPAEFRPDAVVIHSWNPDGAKAMERILKQAGVKCSRKPFEFKK